MNKKFVLIVLTALVIFILIGCSNVETSTTFDEEALENQEIIDAEEAKVEEIDTTKIGIQNVIDNEVAIEEAVWSNDEKMVCFSKLLGDGEYALYIWEVGNEKEKELNGVVGNLYDFVGLLMINI